MDFEKLDVWKRSSRLCCELYKYLGELKDYGFRDQITRSALSIPSNIAEGMEQESNRQKRRYLHYAKGSCGELQTQLYIGIDIEYLNREAGLEWLAEAKELSAMLSGLLKALEK